MSSINKFQLFNDVDSINVVADDLDIRNLVYTSDSITAYQGGAWVSSISDGADTLAINSDGSINVVGTLAVDDRQNSAMANSNVVVNDTAVAVPATALTNRERIIIQNIGAHTVYLGGAGVSSSNGIILPKGNNVELSLGPALTIYAICDAGKTSNLRVLELA